VVLTDRHKRILKWVGYPLLSLFTFVMTLHLTFPYDRIKDKLVDDLSDKYEVSVGSVEPTILPGGLVISKLMLRPRPKKPDEDPPLLQIKRLELDASLLSAIRGRLDVDIDADIGTGAVTGNVVATKAGMWAEFQTKKLALQDVPGLSEAIGLPMERGLNAKISLHLPKQRWREAEGKIQLSCPGCTAGDGVAKIKPRARPRGRVNSQRAQARTQFIGDGIEVPRLDLGDLHAVIEIKAGKGKITEFNATSPDGELHIDGDIDFRDPFKRTQLSGCLRFKFTDEFAQREPKFANVGALTGVEVQPDGFTDLRITGPLSNLRFRRPRGNCKAGGAPGTQDRGGTRAGGAPTITINKERPAPPAAPAHAPAHAIDGAGGSGPISVEKPAVPPQEPPKPAPKDDKPAANPAIHPDEQARPGDHDVAPGAPPEGDEGDQADQGQDRRDDGADEPEQGDEPPAGEAPQQ